MRQKNKVSFINVMHTKNLGRASLVLRISDMQQLNLWAATPNKQE